MGLIPRASASGLDTLNPPSTHPFPFDLDTHSRSAERITPFDALRDLSPAAGAAFFCDSGLAWFQDELLARRRFHSSAGFGLRFENLKAAGSAVVRLDAAYNFDRRRFNFIVSSDLLFRALSSMEFVEPVPGRTALN